MKRTNAERQKAYRARKRNARNAAPAPIAADKLQRKDFYRDGKQYVYLGD